MTTNVGQKSVRVLSGTGNARFRQVNITGGTGQYPTWVQLTALQYAQGPTGSFETVQALNTGTTGGLENKTVRISGYLGPA